MSDDRKGWRIAYSILLLLIFAGVIAGVGYMWYTSKGLPDEMAALVGTLVLGLLNEIKQCGNFLYGEAALSHLYNKQTQNEGEP